MVGEVHSVTVLNTDRLPPFQQLAGIREDAPLALLDCYFQAVADALLDRVVVDTTEKLSLVEAAGIAALDFSSMTRFSLGIHLFTWAKSRAGSAGCWAICRQPALQLNIPPARIWRDACEWMSSEFGLDSLPDSHPIDRTARTFARQMQDARTHLAHGRINDAFLYFVIALDHLLGEDGRNVSTVVDRTSVLTHNLRSRTFTDEAARVRHVYNMRSRLVHSGSPITAGDLREADEIARCVLWAITRVVAAGDVKDRDAWVKTIDKLAHLYLGAPDLVTADRLATVGATATFRAGPPPPMLEYSEGVGNF